tara:strand:+ start:9528 stop:10139 length:612 start_codon:yes stop_codon:yes gene_type:complete
MNKKLLRIFAIILSIIIIGFLFAWQYGFLSPEGSTPTSRGIAKIGGPFTLMDHNGVSRTERDYKGKFLLVYFGFTFCPDVCPTALQIMTVALTKIGKKANLVQPIFITVDPERDTKNHLKNYISNFHPNFVGLTGKPEQIKQAAQKYRVYFRKAEPRNHERSADYMIDHSSIIFLMDKKGKYLTHFSHTSLPSQIAAKLETLL